MQTRMVSAAQKATELDAKQPSMPPRLLDCTSEPLDQLLTHTYKPLGKA